MLLLRAYKACPKPWIHSRVRFIMRDKAHRKLIESQKAHSINDFDFGLAVEIAQVGGHHQLGHRGNDCTGKALRATAGPVQGSEAQRRIV